MFEMISKRAAHAVFKDIFVKLFPFASSLGRVDAHCAHARVLSPWGLSAPPNGKCCRNGYFRRANNRPDQVALMEQTL
jgi:hypothetical protein